MAATNVIGSQAQLRKTLPFATETIARMVNVVLMHKYKHHCRAHVCCRLAKRRRDTAEGHRGLEHIVDPWVGRLYFTRRKIKSTIGQRRCAGARNTGARTKRICGSETSALERRIDTVRLGFVAASHDKSMPTGTLHGTLKFAYETVVIVNSGA